MVTVLSSLLAAMLIGLAWAAYFVPGLVYASYLLNP
jgi:hypothetical protein